MPFGGTTDEEPIIQTDLERLYADNRDELLAYFTRLLPNPADAEDFVQRTFERVLDNPDPALIPLVASGLLKNEYRDDARSRHLSYEALIGEDGTGLDHLPQFQTPSYDDLAFAEDHDLAVRSLEQETRDAYILGELRGLPSREAGPVMGVSHATAAARRVEATIAIREGIAA